MLFNIEQPKNIKNINICYKNLFSEYCRFLGTKWTKCRGCMKLPSLPNIPTSLGSCYDDGGGEHTHRSKTNISLLLYNVIILTFLH